MVYAGILDDAFDLEEACEYIVRAMPPSVLAPAPLQPGENPDRRQYESPRFKRGKGKRCKDYQC